MIITEITEVSKARCRVVIDQEVAFVLYKGDLRIYHLKQDSEITAEIYQILLKEVLPKRAKLRCMNLLKSRDYTEAELMRKLQTGGYPKEVAQEAVDYVRSYGYVGNENYARKYIETYGEVRSYRRLEQELIRKGIPKDIVEMVYRETMSEADDPEPEQIRRLLIKKGYSEQTTTREEKMKLFAFLARKGYSVEKIRKCMGNFELYEEQL